METTQGDQTLLEIVEENIKKWNIRNRKVEMQQRPMPVIAVSREAGSLGRAVADRLAEKLGYRLYAENMISLIAETAHVDETSVLNIDEKGRSFVLDLLEELNTKYRFQSGNYFDTLVKTIGTINWQGGGVILGRGAAFIVRGKKANLVVRFTAPLEWRIGNMARECGISEEEARSRIHELDSARRAFIRNYFSADIDDPRNFDLVINNEFMDVETSVAVVLAALESKIRESERAR